MTPKPNILILTWEISPAFVGGLGILVKDLVTELQKQGAEVTVLIPNIPDDTDIPNTVNLRKSTKKYFNKNQEIEGLPLEMDYYERNLKKYAKETEWQSIFKGKKNTSKAARLIYPNETPKITKAFAWAVLEWLKKNPDSKKFDCILGMDWMSMPTMHLLQKNNIKIPFCVYVNSTEYERSLDQREKTPPDIAVEELETALFPKADHLIAVSGITKNILVEKYNVPENKVTVVYNDVDFTPSKTNYNLVHKGKNVLFLGRLAKQKGLTFLIETAQKVVEIDPGVQFLIAGDGERLPKAVEQVAYHDLEKNVLFLGWTNTKEKKLLYSTADLFVMPSPSEPFGLTALEAIKSGVAVIASTNCGFVDLVKSTPTFRYHDTQTFVNLILFFLHNPADREQLVKLQQSEIAQHSWTKEVSKVVQLASRNLKL